jgi:hypothetical protein
MNKKLLSCLVAGALGTSLALASPVFARGGGGGGMHGGMGGGMHGGMGGGMHSGRMHIGGMGGGMHVGGMRGAHFSGSGFAGTHFAHAGFSHRFHGHRFHHRFNRFAFVGAPFAYAAYDSCWRRTWTPYGLQWVDVCSNYGY